jgi:hypothetical protein
VTSADLFLLVVMTAAAAPYLLAPIRVFRRNRISARPAFEPFDPAGHTVPPGLAEQVARHVAALAPAGFQQVADLFRADPGQPSRMRVVLLAAPATGEIALVTAAYSPSIPRIQACALEFPTRFTGERSLTVTNSVQPGVFGAIAGRVKERLPEIRDPERLLRVHRALLARRYDGVAREAIDYRGDPAGMLVAAMQRELRQQVGTGYLRLDERAGVYRPTWKGAFLMSWKLVSPVRELRRWRDAAHARALLRELGMVEGDAAPIATTPDRAPLRWNWIAVLAAAVLLVARPASLERVADPARASRPIPLPSGFTVPDDFAGAVRALERLTGAAATPLVVQDSLGEPRTTPGVAVAVPEARAAALVAAAHDPFFAKGFYLFRVAQHFGIKGEPDSLALYPSRDRYQVLRVVGSNGANYGIGPDSIVAWLGGLEREQPFVLTGIGFDWIEGRFTTPITDADALARRFHEFCPDIVEQGTGTVAALARELRRSEQLYCWWD